MFEIFVGKFRLQNWISPVLRLSVMSSVAVLIGAVATEKAMAVEAVPVALTSTNDTDTYATTVSELGNDLASHPPLLRAELMGAEPVSVPESSTFRLTNISTPLAGTPLQNSQPIRSAPSISELETEVASPPLTSPGTSEGGNRSINQVTSVTQLSDLKPTDWAYQAVQSLVERYGCIVGYPNSTFLGNRSATRFELAAALNACLDVISDRFATKEDLLAVRRLQEEFAKELATLKGRVNNLEARTAKLEAQQFSTTTKLSGLAFFNMTGAFASSRGLRAEGIDGILPFRVIPGLGDRDPLTNRPRVRTVTDNPNVTVSGLVWLTLNTSFTGKDLLTTQLAVGNGVSPANVFAAAGLFNTWGTPFTDQTAGPDNGSAQFVLRELNYSFPVTSKLQVVVGPRINWYKYFDNNAYTFFLNGTSSFDSIGSPLMNASKRGAGAILIYKPIDQLQFRVGYLAQSIEFLPSFLNSAENPGPDQGFFGGTNTFTGEVTYSPLKSLNLRFLYTRTNLKPVFGGLIGGTGGLPIWGLADDGLGGNLDSGTSNTFGFNFDWTPLKNFGIFGRYTFASTSLDPVDPTLANGKVQNQSIQFGTAFLNLGKPGARATLSFVIPSDIISGRRFLVAGGGDGGRQYDFEATYFYPVNDNISVVPAFYAIINPNNFSSNPTVFVANLRVQFSF
jgi:hypothetical protein